MNVQQGHIKVNSTVWLNCSLYVVAGKDHHHLLLGLSQSDLRLAGKDSTGKCWEFVTWQGLLHIAVLPPI